MKILFYLPVFLLIFYTFSIFYRSDSSFDQDLGRHLKLGEIIINTGSVPTVNLFSYTNPDFKFINHHFLFEVFIYLWSQLLELQTLLVFKIVLILISVGLVLSIIKKSNYPLLLLLGYIFLHVLRERTELRPEIFSFFFASLTIFILEKFSDNKKTKFIFLLPLIQLFWVNTHIYFFVGLAIQGIYAVNFYISHEYRKFRILIFIISASFTAGLINPHFIEGLLYPLTIFNNYGYTVAENQSIFLLEGIGFKDNNFLFVKILSLIILFSIFVAYLKHNFSFKNTAIPLLGLIMALMNIRSFPYLFFLSFPFVLQNFAVTKFNKKITFLTVVSGILLIMESMMYLNGNYYRYSGSAAKPELVFQENVKDSMDFVLSNNLPQPIYNNFDIGSYIIYRGYPKYKVFVDGRPESYPASFFQNIYIPSQSNPAIFQQLDTKYNFQTIIFSITDQTPWGKSFLSSITENPDWNTVYLDKFMIILVKSNRLQEYHLQSIFLNNTQPNNYRYTDFLSYASISLFLINTGNIDSAKLFAKKSWELSPDNAFTKSLFLYTLQTSKNLSDTELIQELNKTDNPNIWW